MGRPFHGFSALAYRGGPSTDPVVFSGVRSVQTFYWTSGLGVCHNMTSRAGTWEHFAVVCISHVRLVLHGVVPCPDAQNRVLR